MDPKKNHYIHKKIVYNPSPHILLYVCCCPSFYIVSLLQCFQELDIALLVNELCRIETQLAFEYAANGGGWLMQGIQTKFQLPLSVFFCQLQKSRS